MSIKRFSVILKEARAQFSREVVMAGLELDNERQREEKLIEKMANVISEFVDAGERPGVSMLGAFRVAFSTVEALAGNIDEVIDQHEQDCGCDGTGKKDPNNNGGLLH